jgi:hypothetical protein
VLRDRFTPIDIIDTDVQLGAITGRKDHSLGLVAREMLNELRQSYADVIGRKGQSLTHFDRGYFVINTDQQQVIHQFRRVLARALAQPAQEVVAQPAQPELPPTATRCPPELLNAAIGVKIRCTLLLWQTGHSTCDRSSLILR